jgi:hypothetical protein
MIDLHLYVVKMFGCVAADFEIPVDVNGMAEAIRQRRPYPNVYLGVGKRTWLPHLHIAGPSDVEAVIDKNTGRCVFAVWFLIVGAWQFQFIYSVPGEQREGLRNTWNPIAGKRTRQIRLKRFDAPLAARAPSSD